MCTAIVTMNAACLSRFSKQQAMHTHELHTHLNKLLSKSTYYLVDIPLFDENALMCDWWMISKNNNFCQRMMILHFRWFNHESSLFRQYMQKVNICISLQLFLIWNTIFEVRSSRSRGRELFKNNFKCSKNMKFVNVINHYYVFCRGFKLIDKFIN